MSQTYDTLVSDARDFLNELADNNSREWFNQRKRDYEALIKQPARALLVDFASEWSVRIDQPLTPKLFRANRDVRFSEDKSPYNTHLHMQWSEPGGLTWFLGIAPDYVSVGAGMMGFDRGQIERWRNSVDGMMGAQMTGVLSRFNGRIDPPELKRVPPPFGADHPYGTLLRRKSLVLWQDIATRPQQIGLHLAIREAFDPMRPAMDLLRMMA